MLRKCIFALILVAAPALVQAFDCTNFYLRGFAGVNFLSIPSLPEASIETDVGYALGGAVGCKFANIFRMEAELTFRGNSLDQLIVEVDSNHIPLDLDGESMSFAYMGNIFFDLPFGWIFVPYFGAGLGGYNEWGKIEIPALEEFEDYAPIKIKGEGGAYQLIAGLNFLPLNKTKVGIEYHFFDAIDDSKSNRNHTLAITCLRAF